jgi:hypothetical protein
MRSAFFHHLQPVQIRVETLIAQLFKYVSSGGYLMKDANHMAKYAPTKSRALLTFSMFRYTCEFNITQYGEDAMTDLTQYSEKVRRT